MNVWEHYEQFGSKEGINPSNSFNAESYIAAKTKLMNETQEGGRANWTIAEVKAAFEENGLSALDHYNLFGQDEFKAAGKETALADAIKVADADKVTADSTFDPFSGVQTYATTQAALDAQEAGSLAENYAIKDATGTVDVTVARSSSPVLPTDTPLMILLPTPLPVRTGWSTVQKQSLPMLRSVPRLTTSLQPR